MVPDRRTESSQIKFIHKAVNTFLPKVVLRLLNQDQKLQLSKLEAITKNSVNLKLISNNLIKLLSSHYHHNLYNIKYILSCI